MGNLDCLLGVELESVILLDAVSCGNSGRVQGRGQIPVEEDIFFRNIGDGGPFGGPSVVCDDTNVPDLCSCTCDKIITPPTSPGDMMSIGGKKGSSPGGKKGRN